MITGGAVSALLLHHCRRVVVRRAGNYDFAGALPRTTVGPPSHPNGRIHSCWRPAAATTRNTRGVKDRG